MASKIEQAVKQAKQANVLAQLYKMTRLQWVRATQPRRTNKDGYEDETPVEELVERILNF